MSIDKIFEVFLLKSKYSSPILTNSLSTLLPGLFWLSNANRIPLTWGKRPSSFGHWLTPFSRHSKTWDPWISSSIIGSIIGRTVTRSLTKNGPAVWIVSDRNVPELIRAKSAFVAATMISQTKLPRFVSLVRIDANVPSKSHSNSPSSLILKSDAKYCLERVNILYS